MDNATVQQLLESRLADYWGQTTTVAWDNIPAAEIAGRPFIAPTIDWTGSTITGAGTGGNNYRRTGVMAIMVHVPRQKGSNYSGTRYAAQLADQLEAIFRGWASGSLQCTAPFTNRVGPMDAWFVYRVLVPFYADICQ